MRHALALFAFGLALRLLFWFATPDHGLAWHSGFQGDAPVWQDLARKVATGTPDELLKLPLRPPGMQWLVELCWDGSGTPWLLRGLFVILGAALGPLLFLQTRRPLGHGAAFTAGALVASSSNLLLLGSGLHNELPYLALLMVTLGDQERLRTAPSPWVALRWGALHGALILLRPEHLLTVAALLALLWLQHAPRLLRTGLLAFASAALLLVPWQLRANRMVDAYNTTGGATLPAAGVAMPGWLPWTPDALAALQALPAFQQGPNWQFLSATVKARGGREVTAADLGILHEAYDCWPEPLPHALVCLYGGLNFFLANSPEANGGFSQQALDRPPPLAGGPDRYPPGLLANLPRDGQLALAYPPHLDRVVHGYARGFAEWTADPLGSLRRIGRKLWFGLQGATGGLGGRALPIGLSGERRPVDLVTATGWWPMGWTWLVATFAAAGLWTARRATPVQAWTVVAATKLVVLAAFFGYARQGALLVPFVALGLGLAADRWLAPRLPTHLASRLWLMAALLLAGGDALRIGTAVFLDQQPLAQWRLDHGHHRLEFR